MSNPNHKSTAEEDAFLTSITDDTVIDVAYSEIIPDCDESDEE